MMNNSDGARYRYRDSLQNPRGRPQPQEGVHYTCRHEGGGRAKKWRRGFNIILAICRQTRTLWRAVLQLFRLLNVYIIPIIYL